MPVNEAGVTAKNEAEISALVKVIEAREGSLLSKRNLKKLEDKVCERVAKLLAQCRPEYKVTLKEKLVALSENCKKSRHLPAPESSFKPAKEYRSFRQRSLQEQESRDQDRWLSLPEDIKQSELEDMRNMFFPLQSSKRHNSGPAMQID